MKNILRRIAILILSVTLSVTLIILTFINGWGLVPHSWWWIIGVGFFWQVFAHAIGYLAGIWPGTTNTNTPEPKNIKA